MNKHFQVLIIGAGTAGVMVAAQLKRRKSDLSIGIIDPSEHHYYQPAFTLVGAGTFDMKNTMRPQASIIPKGVTWLKDYATVIHEKESKVDTKDNGSISYDYLVVATGLSIDLSIIEGLEEAIDKGVVCSNYIDPEHTWKTLQNFKEGNAIFTQAATPIKCGGAPQKAMYLSADYFRKNKLSDKINTVFATPGSEIFNIKKIANTLMSVIDRYNINLKLQHSPVKIDADKKIVYFKVENPKKTDLLDIPGSKLTDDNLLAVPFGFLHLAPPQKAPDFIEKSNLINETGWLDVDIHSLQHNQFKNIFGLGDVAGLPTSKTGAAIRKQAPIVVDNLTRLINNQKADNKGYDGYTSCPIVTGYGKMTLAEFDYEENFTPDPMLKFMLVFKSYKEHWRLWMLKKYALPFMYWNRMMKGKM